MGGVGAMAMGFTWTNAGVAVQGCFHRRRLSFWQRGAVLLSRRL